MNRILIDAKVLEVLLERQSNAERSAEVWKAIETGASEGLLAPHAIPPSTTSSKGTRRYQGKTAHFPDSAGFSVAAVDGAVIEEALRLSLLDFEDAVTASVARSSECDYIVTRDPKGFRGSSVRPLTPEAALPLLGID